MSTEAANDPPLTREQIANWRNAVPELRNATDIEIQLYRDRMQQWADSGTQDASALSGDNDDSLDSPAS